MPGARNLSGQNRTYGGVVHSEGNLLTTRPILAAGLGARESDWPFLTKRLTRRSAALGKMAACNRVALPRPFVSPAREGLANILVSRNLVDWPPAATDLR